MFGKCLINEIIDVFVVRREGGCEMRIKVLLFLCFFVGDYLEVGLRYYN